MIQRRHRFPRASGLLACLPLFVVGCGTPRETAVGEPADDRPVVAVADARIGSLRDDLVTSGQVVPASAGDWTVVAPQTAEIVEIPHGPGDTVEAGDVLVRFEIPTLTGNYNARELAVIQARARVETTQTEAARLSSLYERGIIARQQHEAAQADMRTAAATVAQAEALFEEARLLLDAAVVRARFPGLIREQWHIAGDFASATPDDPILRVVDPTRLEIAVQVPVDRVGRIVEGQMATVRTADGELTEQARVSRRVSAPTPENPTVEVRLIPEGQTALEMDALVGIEILLDERHDVLLIPTIAIQRERTGVFVMVATDGVALRRNVQIGLTVQDQAQVVDGLAPGEQVIIRGLEDLTDGVSIVIGR